MSVYLDYAATTPLDKRVWEAMRPWFSRDFGNPSSVHRYGQRAEHALESAREQVAEILGCHPREIIFTSGGTEADNLALRGVALARRERVGANRILTTRAEHPAVSKTAEHLEKHFGFQVTWLRADKHGMILPEAVAESLDDRVALVSVMYANNEVGTINPVAEIAALCRARGVPFHTDAVQAAVYLPLNVEDLGVDLLSLGGHKFYGPKGIGVLYIRRGTPILPCVTGGAQELGLRAGTHNVPYIVGLARALHLTTQERAQRIDHVLPLRDEIIRVVLSMIPQVNLTGHPERRLPNHASFVFKHVDGNLLLTLLDAAGFACSSGSACKTGSPMPSEILSSMGWPEEWARGSLRVTLGAGTTAEEVRAFLQTLPPLVAQARGLVGRNAVGSIHG